MPALTKTQLDHAKQRLAEAKQKYLVVKIAELGSEPNDVELSNEEMLFRIRTGRARFKNSRVLHYTNVVDAFEYLLTPGEQDQKTARVAWEAKRDAVTAKATAIEQQTIDKLVMSPDGMDALAEIAAAFTS